jgi:hypothetical protein
MQNNSTKVKLAHPHVKSCQLQPPPKVFFGNIPQPHKHIVVRPIFMAKSKNTIFFLGGMLFWVIKVATRNQYLFWSNSNLS